MSDGSPGPGSNRDLPLRAVLGGGSWGTTIAHLIATTGHPVRLWLRDGELAREINEERQNSRYLPEARLALGIEATTDLAHAVGPASLVFVAIPSDGFREVASMLGDLVTGEKILVSGTKGLEEGTFARMSTVLKLATCAKKVGALSGPNLAKEILRGHPTATVLASHYPEVVRLATACLASSRLRVYGNRDIVGVEIAGALKNVIAIAAGMADGLGFEANTKALIITRGLAEIRRLGERLGAEPDTFSGLAGVGDLMVTCGSRLSRNNQVGYRLGKGEALDAILESMVEVAEGVRTARLAYQLASSTAVEMPIVEGVYRILHEGLGVAEALEDLMGREARYEVDRPGSAAPPALHRGSTPMGPVKK